MSVKLYNTDVHGTDAAYLSANLLIATLYALNMCDTVPVDATDLKRASLPIRSLTHGGQDTAYRATSDALTLVFVALLDGDREGAEYARELISDHFGDSNAAQECIRYAKAWIADQRFERMTPAQRDVDHEITTQDDWTCDTCGHMVNNRRHE